MNTYLTQYQKLAYRTAKSFPTLKGNLVHAALGLQTESGEFVTNVKRITIYGKAVTTDMLVNMCEEIGDFCWYLALAATSAGIDLAELDYESWLDEDILDTKVGVLGELERISMMLGGCTMGVFINAVEFNPEHFREALSMGLAAAVLISRYTKESLEDTLDSNIAKLRLRFPDAYSDEAAEARADKGGLPASVS